MELIDRNRQDLLIGTRLIVHHQAADRAGANDCAGNHRCWPHHEDVHGIAIAGECMGDEAVISWIEHGCVEKTVHEHCAGLFVQLVLHGLAALRNLNQGVDVVRRVHTYRDFRKVHGEMAALLLKGT